VTTALETALEVLSELRAIHIQRDNIKVSIQGFGNIGSFTARFLDSAGIKVVAISDVSGLVCNKDGLNIPRLMIDMKGKSILSDLTGYDILDKNQIFEFNSDIFIPAAMENVIIDKTSSTADEYLNKNGVWLIPDFLANAGGVIGSFVEYQGRTEKEAFELIRYKISKNIKNILTQAIMKRIPEY
jgi:glutamate dehydrogenase/leucine dehydrogenase